MSAQSNQTIPKGFTLVELLVVISIIAILSVIGITIFSSAQKATRDARRRSDLKAIANALEQYKAANGYYPSSGVPGVTAWYCSSSRGTYDADPGLSAALTPYFSGSLPIDPLNNTTYKYMLDIDRDAGYFLYAALENPPPQPWPTIQGDGCVGAGHTVHYLIRYQQ